MTAAGNLSWALVALAPWSSLPAARPAGGGVGAAWGFPGHRVVCEIAWLEMSAEARAEARRLTRADGTYDTFAESCVWADLPEARQLRNAHWINLPPGSDSVSMAHCPDDCLLRHLEAEAAVLADPTRSDADRARALRFVGHLVGDVHQPLHVAYAYDRGGNGHEITGLGDRIDDLHAVWDSYVIEHLAGRWREAGAELHEDVNPVDRRLWAATDPLEWANESYRITEDYAYENLEGPDGNRLSADFAVVNRQTAERQLKKAGVRLGALLDRLLTNG